MSIMIQHSMHKNTRHSFFLASFGDAGGHRGRENLLVLKYLQKCKLLKVVEKM